MLFSFIALFLTHLLDVNYIIHTLAYYLQVKKTFCVILLLIFLFNLVGYYVFFEVRRAQIKEEITTSIKKITPESKLHRITLSNTELSAINWKEKNKEFYFKGELYDIVKKEITGNNTVFYCINDKKEKTLYAQLEKIINETGNSENSKNSDSGLDLFFTDVSSLVNANLTSFLFYFGDLQQNLNRFHFPIQGPPPKLV